MRRSLVSIVGGLLVWAAATPASAQHAADMLIGSSTSGGGAWKIQYDFSSRVQTTASFSVAGVTLYTSTNPGFDAIRVSDPASASYRLNAGVQVRVLITAIHAGCPPAPNQNCIAMKLGSTTIDAVGESAVIGTMNVAGDGLHLHPEWKLTLPDGVVGEFTVSFKLTETSPAYTESVAYTMTLTNLVATPTPTTTATPTATASATPTLTPTPMATPTPTPTATPTLSATPGATPTASASPQPYGFLPPVELDATLYDRASVKCQRVVGATVRRLAAKRYGLITSCLDRIELVDAQSAAAGVDSSRARARALAACGAKLVERLDAAMAAAVDAVDGGCGTSASNDFTPGEILDHLDRVACRVDQVVGAAHAGSRASVLAYELPGSLTMSRVRCLGTATAPTRP